MNNLETKEKQKWMRNEMNATNPMGVKQNYAFPPASIPREENPAA